MFDVTDICTDDNPFEGPLDEDDGNKGGEAHKPKPIEGAEVRQVEPQDRFCTQSRKYPQIEVNGQRFVMTGRCISVVFTEECHGQENVDQTTAAQR